MSIQLLFTIFFIVAVIFSAIIHEYMHAWMANQLGDPTAKNAGRLTLNPLVHIDPFLTILLPIITTFLGFPFGGAKPVPYNPYNLTDKQYGPAKVALAGPVANLVTALFFGLIFRFAPLPNLTFALMIQMIVFVNVLLMVFNLLPIPPLDGSKVLMPFLPANMQLVMMRMEQFGIILVYGLIMLFSPFIFPLMKFISELILGHSLLF